MIFKRTKKQARFVGGGLVLFQSVEEAIAAEKFLWANNYDVKLVAPPPQLRKGCDLAVEFNIVEKAGVERLLRQKDKHFAEILPVKGAGELLDVVKVKYFADACMVKAGNMKLTFDKNTGVILNISGGGCPDIPYLHLSMVDKKITDVARPKDKGHTLCALMLDRAFVEALEIFRKETN
ncbi:MAG TPA: DUF3343 domain-containing protein [Smithellaceae bacterium]|nr:DUF3343 domain-containing protein [Smithellaceae bacterium]HNT91954.1 DUF3343 domain-containing protein [Smithellaceae bacterium]HNV65397.1 DUF3343 domain-containing protein [Smithellaceae bacterium]HPW24095.1 DUF3343 domain-containing protein [Smithellaceae bacterium]